MSHRRAKKIRKFMRESGTDKHKDARKIYQHLKKYSKGVVIE